MYIDMYIWIIHTSYEYAYMYTYTYIYASESDQKGVWIRTCIFIFDVAHLHICDMTHLYLHALSRDLWWAAPVAIATTLGRERRKSVFVAIERKRGARESKIRETENDIDTDKEIQR